MLKVDGVEIDYSGLPAEHRDTVRRYVECGISPGTGWLLILSHDLAAVCYCDPDTAAQLPQIFRWIYNHAPVRSHGSHELVKAWMDRRQRALDGAA